MDLLFYVISKIFSILFQIDIFQSSLLGQSKYIRFYIDWLIELFASGVVLIIIIMSVTIYVGIFLYIVGMVTDMKMRMTSIGSDPAKDKLVSQSKNDEVYVSRRRIWSIYMEEMEFHIKIIGYLFQNTSDLRSVLLIQHIYTEFSLV